MKILVLTNLFPPHYIGGYELICHAVVRALRSREHDVRVLTSDHTVPGGASQRDEPEVERTLRIHGFFGHRWLGIRSLAGLEAHNNRILAETIQRYGPELVYVWNMGGLSKSMLLTLQRLGIPTVFYMSDHWIARGLKADVWLDWWNRKNPSRLQRAARALLTATGVRRCLDAKAPTCPITAIRFPRIYFCSQALRRLTAAAGFQVGHGAVIYPPVNVTHFCGEPRTANRPVERLLWVGRLAEDKGILTALKAMAQLRGRFAGSLSIYGTGDAAFVNSLTQFVVAESLNAEFKSTTQAQMPEVYASHDALLFTSEWQEPFALTPLEAMACGLPVIATMTGGSAELFRHGENALTYNAGNAQELAERIEQLASDHALRARIAVAGFCEVRQRHAEPVIVDQIEQYLHETVAGWNDFRRSAQAEMPARIRGSWFGRTRPVSHACH